MDPASITIIMAAIGWLASALVSRLLTEAVEEWAKIAYLGDEVDSLKKKLQEIMILLDNAQRSNLTNWPLLQSVCDLQQAVYDAEDLLEELDYYRLQDMVEGKHDHSKNVSAKKPCKCTILFRDVVSCVKNKCWCSCCCINSVSEPESSVPMLDKRDMSKRLNDVVKKLDHNGEVVSKALSLENLGRIAESLSVENLEKIAENLFRKNKKKSETSGNKTLTQVNENMLGRKLREKETVEIVNHLVDSNSGVENIWVLPICGHGGVGKTTLAKFVFYDEKVKEYFDERMWLRVSHNLDVKNLTLEMIGISRGEQEEVGIYENLEGLHNSIKIKLESKKVLLVADNMCQEDMNDERWDWLRELFTGTARKGTKILVTTRNQHFAKNIETAGCIIKLDGLKGNDLEALFDACAYWDKDPQHYPMLNGLRQRLINKLHGYPLEIKQIGAVLRSKLDFEHWNAVLNSDEWKKPKIKDESKDIMSSLEISYRYLPYNYQKCFLYCSLFPKNFKFKGDDMINLWIAQGFIYSKDGCKSKELGVNCLDELVGRGFLEKVEEDTKYHQTPKTYYLMHELLYDMAKTMSSKEFVTIDGSNVSTISNSIRHVSIITYSAYKCNSNTKNFPRNESFENKVEEIGKKLEIEKLRTLILIGDYDSNFARTFRNQFRNAKYLRVLSLSMESFGINNSILCNFSNSLLLRYLKLHQSFNHSLEKEDNKSSNHKFVELLFWLYHLETLDISDWYDYFEHPQLTCRLVSLRHFHARGKQLAKIIEIGKLQRLEELREFTVKDNLGFDIGQLGQLKELGGSLSIYNLENINSKEEVTKANLVGKTDLRNLSLHWSSKRSYDQPDHYASILKHLKPPPNIRNLDIHEYTGTKFPKWMVGSHSRTSLRSLNLINCFNVEDFPPLGQLEVLEKLHFKGMHKVKEVTEKFYGDCTKEPFKSLGELVFNDMEKWEKWVGIRESTVFPSLKKLELINCPILTVLPLHSDSSGIIQPFPCLVELNVKSCQKLVLPPLPHTEKLAKFNIHSGSDQLKSFVLSLRELSIEWNKQSRTFNQEVLVFSNLKKLTELSIKGCPIACLPWEGFKKLTSLKRLIIEDVEENNPSRGEWVLPESLELLEISSNYVTGRQLSEWLLCLPSLLSLVIKSSGITCLEVEDESTTSTEITLSDDSYNSIQIFAHKLKSLKEITINGCKNLVSLHPQNGLRGFTSLEKLTIKNCSRLLDLLVERNDIPILPPSLLKLEIDWLPENLLSKLVSNPSRLEHMKLGYSPKLKSLSMGPFGALQELNIETCRALCSLKDVGSLSSLRQLDISKCPKLAADWEAASQKKESMNENFSIPLNVLTIDDASFLTKEMYKYLPTLEKLVFDSVQTEALQEEGSISLVNLKSLREINFQNCPNIQSLPNKLSDLTHLSRLKIRKCPEIKSLPDDLPHIHDLYIDRSNNQLEPWCRKHCSVTKLHVS